MLEIQQCWNAHVALRMIHLYRKEYISIATIVPDHKRDERCRRANVVATFEYPGTHSDVVPPQNSGRALEVQQYRNERGTVKRAGIAMD